jgi:hypothetical protein
MSVSALGAKTARESAEPYSDLESVELNPEEKRAISERRSRELDMKSLFHPDLEDNRIFLKLKKHLKQYLEKNISEDSHLFKAHNRNYKILQNMLRDVCHSTDPNCQ